MTVKHIYMYIPVHIGVFLNFIVRETTLITIDKQLIRSYRATDVGYT